jgi:hypothetical protein
MDLWGHPQHLWDQQHQWDHLEYREVRWDLRHRLVRWGHLMDLLVRSNLKDRSNQWDQLNYDRLVL